MLAISFPVLDTDIKPGTGIRDSTPYAVRMSRLPRGQIDVLSLSRTAGQRFSLIVLELRPYNSELICNSKSVSAHIDRLVRGFSIGSCVRGI